VNKKADRSLLLSPLDYHYYKQIARPLYCLGCGILPRFVLTRAGISKIVTK